MQGQVIPGRFSVSPRAFSRFTYAGDPYELLERSRRPTSPRQNKPPPGTTQARHPLPFLNAASVPTGPKHTPVFEAFSYTIDPHERRDEVRKARLAADHEKMRAGAFKAGGRAFRGDKRAMQSRQGELLKGVQRCFRTDWNAYLGTTVRTSLATRTRPVPHDAACGGLTSPRKPRGGRRALGRAPPKPAPSAPEA